MKINKTILLLLLAVTIKGYSQNWQSINSNHNSGIISMYGDTTNNILYCSGYFDTIGGIQTKKIAQWNGTTWDSLKSGLTFPAGTWRSFCIYNNKLVFPNIYFNINRFQIISWDGNQFDSIGSNVDAAFLGTKTINNELYAFGEFGLMNSINYNSIAKWDGTNWIPIGFPYKLNNAAPIIRCMEYYNGCIYAGGVFCDSSSSGNNIVNIAKYNGSYWSIPGTGFHGSIDDVFDLEVYKGELYAAGAFTTSDGNAQNFIARWNDTIWQDVGGSVTSSGNGQVNALLVLNNKLYAGGVFKEMGGVKANSIAAWDGTNWCGFGNTDTSGVICLASINNDLYLTTASIWDTITVNGIAKWIGGSYVDTCGHINVGIDEIKNEERITIYPNPTSAQFTITTNQQIQNINIYNILGELIIQTKSQTIDLTDQPNGIYFVQIETDKTTFNQKIIKQ
jgi:hypothetical protein